MPFSFGNFKKALELQQKAAADEAFRKQGGPAVASRLAAYRENRRWVFGKSKSAAK